MATGNTERIHELFARWRAQDREGALALVHPEAILDWSASRAPYSGVFRGRDGFDRMWDLIWEAWDEWQPEIVEAVEVGPDTVVIGTHLRARGKGSGVVVEARGGGAWTFRDGKVMHGKLFQSKEDALRYSNLNLVRRAFEEFVATGEVRWETIDPEIEIHDHDVPDAGSYRGHGGFLAWLQNWGEAWDEYAMEAERFVEAGDKVVILLRMKAKGRGSGVEIERADAIVHTVRDGRTIRLDYYNDQGAALRAAGVAVAE